MSAWLKLKKIYFAIKRCIRKIIIIWFVTMNLMSLLFTMNLVYYNHILNQPKAEMIKSHKLSNEPKKNYITFLDKRFVWHQFFENEDNLLTHDEYYWAQFYKDVDESFADDYYSNMLIKFMKSEHEKKSIKSKGVTYYLFRPTDWGHAAYFNNVSNQWIDQLRDDGYLFLRKVNQSSIIDLDYLLRS
eukprot:171620_1